MKIKIEVVIGDRARWSKHKSHINVKSLSNIAKKALDEAKASSVFKSIECTVLLSNDAEIQNYNMKFRKINNPTNVLSFPYEHDLKDNLKLYKNKSIYLGDIVFSFDKIKSEISEKYFHEYVYYLFVHAFLHLLGFVHDTDANSREMEKLQETILKKLDIDYKNF